MINLHHGMVDKVAKALCANNRKVKNIWLYGECGTGKSEIVRNVADKLGLDFYTMSLSAQTTAYKLVGFLDANSNYKATPLRLGYALCSPSLLRRFLFAWMEQKQHRDYCGGYGSPNSIDEVAISKDIIHFKGLDSEQCSYDNEEETKKYIIKLFDEFLKLNNEKRCEND